MEKFDGLNVRRIEAGLQAATQQLESLPEAYRKAPNLDLVGLYAIFEALTCRAMYSIEARLREHFDLPFRLVQTKKFLRIGSYCPAMTHFLFAEGIDRRRWAEKTWHTIKRNISATQYEWSVKEPLCHAMTRVQLGNLQKDFLEQFWKGVHTMINRFDADVIMHSLRGMEYAKIDTDICSLAFNHLQVDDDAFRPLLASMKVILQLSPQAFWDSMGTRPAAAWTEEFFRSPALVRLLQSADSEVFEDIFGWVTPFLQSVKPINQPPIARAVVDKLFGTLQDNSKYSQDVCNYCSNLGLTFMSETLTNLNRERLATPATSGELFESMGRHISLITASARNDSPSILTASEVFRQAIAFDCDLLKSRMTLLSEGKIPPAQTIVFHPFLWTAASSAMGTGNIVLAKKVLLAFRGLAPTEPFVAKNQSVPADREAWNKSFTTFNQGIHDILERINDFEPSTLQQLLSDNDSANATIALLFASDNAVRTAAVEILKTMSTETTRKESVQFAIRDHFGVTINAFSYSFRQLAYQKSFRPAQSALKIGQDMLDALTNSENGILRSKSLISDDARTIESVWQALWQLLSIVFQNTAAWSDIGHEKDVLMDFCRDVMDFGDKLFDQFGVIEGALNHTSGDDDNDDGTASAKQSTGKRLVDQPRNAMQFIVRWLKLRDEFLVAKSCALVCKLLVRLKDFDTTLDDKSITLILECIYGKNRTTMSEQQKAELRRALETHLGHSIEETAPKKEVAVKPAKREFIDLDKWKNNAQNAQAPEALTLDATIASSSTAYTQFKAQQAVKEQAKEQAKAKSKLLKAATASAARPIDPGEFIRRRKQAEEEMKKANQAALLARRKAAGAGSGVTKLGVYGKDHAETKGSDMMVSSGEESSDDSDSETELDQELFGPSTKAPGIKIGLTEDQSRAMKKQQPRGPVKKARIVRSAKDMRARLAPDLSSLHKTLLSWDYFHEGPFPPGSGRRDYAGVVNTFRDATEYQRTFQSLLTLETWSGFLKAKEENTNKPFEIKVLNRSSVDAFVEVSTSMSLPKAGVNNNRFEVGEGDLVLMSKASESSASSPHCMARVHKIIRKKGNVEVLYRVIPGNPLASSLVPAAQVWGLLVMSTKPLEREYGALLGLQYYDLCDEVTRAKPSPLLNYTDEKLQPLERVYNVNKAQAKAIKSALDNDAFTLIQGPPGSGKTKTIVAIVGALLSETLRNKGVMIKQAPQADNKGAMQKKMLICAPSNAAVDEIVMRFKEGVTTLNGDRQKVNVVRIGRSDAINAAVHDVTLEELINKKLNNNSTSQAANATKANNKKIFDDHEEASRNLRDFRAEREGRDFTKEEKETFDNLKRKKTLLGNQIDNLKDNEQQQSRQADLQRRKAMQEVINEAHIICSTLSGSGHEMFQTLDVEFETVVIDEAAQCVELSALIPLKYGCAKCILVGDPQQLPPTVFSRDAAQYKYAQSLFVRMQNNSPKDIHLLDTQYRMHPEISIFPSQTFYDGRLLDGNGMAALRAAPWHATELLSPYRFFDVQGQHSAAPTGHSLVNHAEIRIALQLYTRLLADFPRFDFRGKVGIITPYKSQLRELKTQFNYRLGEEAASGIEFNTTDAFQGREAEIIIFSCVRASPTGGIGFLDDIRRMNVGLTRAKCSLWVLGNSQSLQKGEFWAKLVAESKARDRLTNGDLERMLSVPSKIVRKIEDVKMEGTSDGEDVKVKVKPEPTPKHVKDEPSAPQVKQEIKPDSKPAAKTERHIKVEPRKTNSLIPPLSRLNGTTKPAQAAPPPASNLKRKLSNTDDDRKVKDIKSSRSPSVQSINKDSDTEMKDADASGPPSRPSSSNSNLSAGVARTNGSGPPTTTGGSSGGINGKAPAPPQRPPGGMVRKKADPFIRKKR